MGSAITAQTHEPLRERLDFQPPREARDQRNPGIRDHPLVVEGDSHAIQSGRPVIMHLQSDLLTPGPGCPYSLRKALLTRSFKVQPRMEEPPPMRWIQA